LDGQELPGQTNRVLTFNAVQPEDEGDYTVRVSNSAGATVSEAVRLYVVPASTNFVLRNFTNAAGLRLPYYFFLPSNYDPTRSYPVFCFLHGAGLDERDRGVVITPYPETLVFDSYKQQATDPVILVYPTRRAGDAGWTDQYLRQVSGLLDWLPSNFSIDTNRVYIGGLSEGVHATWDLLGMRPGFFAAARIASGWQGSTPASSIKGVPLWAFHAADDGIVNVSSSRSLIRALRQAGGSPIYTEFMSGGHLDSVLHAVCTPAVNDWFLAQRRGMGSTVGPSLSITNPTQGAIYITSATNLNLAGSAEAPGPFVTPVTWENRANSVKGTGAGTNEWNAMAIPLQADRTNIVVVTATTTSWAPAFGGNTTFNDTLGVVSLPLRISISQTPNGILLGFRGVPSRRYNVERAPIVTGAWSILNTQIAPASGAFEYVDTNPPAAAAFYRASEP
jgi:dienelactone hydrolase